MYHVLRCVLLCVRAVLGLAEAISTLQSQVDAKASADDLSTLQTQVTQAVGQLDTKADADDVAENLAAGATDLSALQTQVTQAIGQLDTKATADDLTALQTVVNALPTTEDVATKAAARDLIALQAQQTINSAAVTALESHGTAGAPIRMIVRFNAHDAHRACMFRTYSGSVGDN